LILAKINTKGVKMTAEEKISKAKTKLVLHHTFFSMLVLKLKFEEDKTCPPMWTDGVRVGYNPKFVEELSMEELVAVICHEAYHILLLHPVRECGRNHILWNIAGDFVINLLLVDSDFRLPKGALLDRQFRDWSTEKVYEHLMKNAAQSEAFGDSRNIGEVRIPKHADGTPYSESEIKELEGELKVTVQQAAQLAKKRGHLPSNLERLVKEIVKPVVNWKDVLQQFVTTFSKNDYTWTKPNRRYMPDIYLPMLESPELGELVVAIDTSGSLSEKELAEIAAEVRAIMSTYKTNLTVIYCDAAVGKVEEFSSGEDITFKMIGGGGTDYVPVFNEIRKRAIEPICLLYFTDGWCSSFPKQIPDYPVLWILTEKTEYFKNPFGNKVIMRGDA